MQLFLRRRSHQQCMRIGPVPAWRRSGARSPIARSDDHVQRESQEGTAEKLEG